MTPLNNNSTKILEELFSLIIIRNKKGENAIILLCTSNDSKKSSEGEALDGSYLLASLYPFIILWPKRVKGKISTIKASLYQHLARPYVKASLLDTSFCPFLN